MSGFYIGVDGKARKVKGGYIGIDGKARKIKKGYIGDENGVARLCWCNDKFADNTWDEIALACSTNNVPESWAVGDQKTMTINGADYVIDIIGKNHDDYSDGTGKAPLTFQLHDCYGNKYGMGSTTSNTSVWDTSIMRTSNLPAILKLMPSTVQSSIKSVKKLTYSGSGIKETAEKLFLLSEVEIFGKNTNTRSGEGVQYAYYVNGGLPQKNMGGAAQEYWERSPATGDSYYFGVVSAAGAQSKSLSKYSRGVAFAFCF